MFAYPAWSTDKVRFKSGMRNLTDQIHAMGLCVASTTTLLARH
jgi:hypothetical protein